MRVPVLEMAVLAALTAACGRTEVTFGPPGAAGVTGAAGTTNVTGVAGATGVAGVTGAAGSAAINAVSPGAGCGKPLPDDQPATVPGTPKGYKRYTVMGTGATLTGTIATKAGERSFWVRVPSDYNPNQAYRTVYLGQGCGGYDVANTNTYPLYKESLGGTEQAIYVALDIPKDMANMDCYDNRDGLSSQEWEAFELFHTVVDSNYCVDNNHVYVAGYSTGGWLANMWGCYFAGDGQKPAGAPTTPRAFAPRYHIRAQAADKGGEPTEQPPCGGPVAAIFIHDQNDNGVPFTSALQALRRVGQTNGCDTTFENESLQTPWHPENPVIGDVCKQFTGCPRDYPVVFCRTIGLGLADQRERSTAAFTLFFDQIEQPR